MQDAFEEGYRVGIVGNSDGHKGRPGASYPGAGKFGAIGGLTCYLVPELSRTALVDAMRKRRHYATTGGPGGRMVIGLRVRFDTEGAIHYDDSALGPAASRKACEALMGDIVHLPEGGLELDLDIVAAAPVERLEIFNGLDLVETWRPYGERDLGRRIRVVWEGAEYRGRFRDVVWDGRATFIDDAIAAARPINFFNRDRTLDQVGTSVLAWRALTTGNFGGFDAWLENGTQGRLRIETPLIETEVALAEIGLADRTYDAGGELPRRLRIFRLPQENPRRRVRLTRRIVLRETGDNAIYVRLTQEDGTLAWTSPVYVYR